MSTLWSIGSFRMKCGCVVTLTKECGARMRLDQCSTCSPKATLSCGCTVPLPHEDINDTSRTLGILDSGLVFCKQCGKTLEQPKKKSVMETIRDALPVSIAPTCDFPPGTEQTASAVIQELRKALASTADARVDGLPCWCFLSAAGIARRTFSGASAHTKTCTDRRDLIKRWGT